MKFKWQNKKHLSLLELANLFYGNYCYKIKLFTWLNILWSTILWIVGIVSYVINSIFII